MLSASVSQTNQSVGDVCGGGPPGPISNPVVKPASADDTAGAARWEPRSLPAALVGFLIPGLRWPGPPGPSSTLCRPPAPIMASLTVGTQVIACRLGWFFDSSARVYSVGPAATNMSLGGCAWDAPIREQGTYMQGDVILFNRC
jgi:hypothetical protein